MARRFLLLLVLLTSSAQAHALPVLAVYAINAAGVAVDILKMMATASGAMDYIDRVKITDESNPDLSIEVPATDNPSKQPSPPTAPATAAPTSPGGIYPPGVSPLSSCTRQNSPAPTARGMESTCEWCIANWAGAGSNYWCWVQSTAQYPQPILYGLYSGPLGTANPNATGTAPAHNPNPTCPSGYGYSSSQCTLSDARQAQPDNKVDYTRSPGGGYQAGSANDADKTNSTVPVNTGANGAIYSSGKTINGEPTTITAKPLANGGSQISTLVGRPNGVVEEQVLTVDGNGQVVDFRTRETPGELSIDQTTGAATIQNLQPVTNPDGSVGTAPVSPGGTFTGSAGGQAIQFPDDYNREVTQQAIKSKLDNTSDVSDPTLPETTGFDDSFFKDTFTGLLAWQLPAHSSECPSPSFDWNNATYTFESHCALVQNHFTTFQAVMTVIYVIVALFILLGA